MTVEEAGLPGLSPSMDLLWTPPTDPPRRELGHSLATQPSLSTLLFLQLMRPMELPKDFRCLRLFRERMIEAISSL